MREQGLRKEIEGEFGMGGEIEGTLVLTNQRLIFVATNEKEMDLSAGLSGMRIAFSDVEDLDAIPKSPPNLFVSLSSIESTQGKKGELRPKLEVAWVEKESRGTRVYTQMVTGKRRKNLNNWAEVIENLKAGKQKLVSLPPVPSSETLEGKVMRVLADMQEKGLFEIQDDVEQEFKTKADLDDLQAVCDKLVSAGALMRTSNSDGDSFYRKCSLLGDADLSG